MKFESSFCRDVGLMIEHVYDQFLALVELQPMRSMVLAHIPPRNIVQELGQN